jgi:hypothetical protein
MCRFFSKGERAFQDARFWSPAISDVGGGNVGRRNGAYVHVTVGMALIPLVVLVESGVKVIHSSEGRAATRRPNLGAEHIGDIAQRAAGGWRTALGFM